MNPATTPTTESTPRASGRATSYPNNQARKDAATAFLREAGAGRAREAFARYATRGFRHHNVYFPGDADSLAAGMDQNAAENPQKKLEIKYVLAEGDTVVVHSWAAMKPGEPGYALAHFENGAF